MLPAGGTSHATALVAGAAALVLPPGHELTWSDVREILRRSARRIDPDQPDPRGQWVDLDGDGAPDFSRWYGHGRLDVDEAVRLALAYVPPPPRRWGLLIGAVAAAAAIAAVLLLLRGGGGARRADPHPRRPCDLPRRAWSDVCPVHDCGSNGTYLSGFFIDGLSLDGCLNYDGVRMVPGSLVPGPRAGARRGSILVDGALIGLDAAGAVVCRGDEIDGTTFTVDGPARALRRGAGTEIQSRELRIGAAAPAADPAGRRASRRR